jgi:superfamily II DNA/RNA helicase
MNTMTRDEILSKLGIASLSAMQEQMAERYVQSKNMVLLSPTGSGKTLAYLIPLVQHLMASLPEGEETTAVRALVLVPSRELALQTEQVIRRMGTPIRAVSVYGGRPAMEEHRTLRGVQPHIVIGTPGRVNDHINKANFPVEGIETLVIDEFDKSLELGFRDEMKQVITRLPKLRKRILLSATEAEEIPLFVGMSDVITLNYVDADAVPRISNHVIHSPEKDKLKTLYQFLCLQGEASTVVFVNHREATERVGNYLKECNVACEVFHGGMEQKDRERALYKFCNGTCNVFVSTDLAARGLDIPDIDNVVHYHLPPNEETYIHRNGRTARWEAQGNSYLIVGPTERTPEWMQGADEYSVEGPIPAPKPSRWSTLYIGKGKKDKISKGDIMGFLSKKGELSREDIGRIDVKEHYAFVAIRKDKLSRLLKKINGEKIKGVKTIIEEAR